MEAYSFLKNRRTGDSGTSSVITPRFSDDGSYFDLQFTLPDVIPEEDEYEEDEDEDDHELCDNEEHQEILLEDSSKFLVSLVKSASKFRLLLLKLKRSKYAGDKSDNGEEEEDEDLEIEEKQGKAPTSKLFTAKFKVDDMKLRLVSLFTTPSKDDVKLQSDDTDQSGTSSPSGEGKMTKEMLQKYFKMVKPLYFLVTKNNYVAKLKLSGNVGFPRGGSVESQEKVVKSYEKQGSSNNLVAKLKVVGKHLGKGQSGDTVVASPPQKVVHGRCDDSMLEVQDGIQGAILHCKKSLNASNSNGNESTSTLCPSMLDQ